MTHFKGYDGCTMAVGSPVPHIDKLREHISSANQGQTKLLSLSIVCMKGLPKIESTTKEPKKEREISTKRVT